MGKYLDETRWRILSEMHEAYMVALHDPLSYHSVAEIECGQQREKWLEHFLNGILACCKIVYSLDYMYTEVAEGTRHEDPAWIAHVKAEIGDLYLKRTAELQAALLIGCFSPHKRAACDFLDSWFKECDVQVARDVIADYLAEAAIHNLHEPVKELSAYIHSWPANKQTG
jgi:hypothetical protein